MKQINICFLNELNDFLPLDQAGSKFVYPFKGSPSVKHVIESIGVPHTEVGEIIVNGDCVDNTFGVCDQDDILVTPITNFKHLLDNNHRYRSINGAPRFLLDNHLGKLALYLRMLGFDSLYRNDYQDDELAEVAHKEHCILLTRDRELLKRGVILFGYWIRSLDPKVQIVEVLQRYDLFKKIHPFNRCLRCNNQLEAVEKEDIIDRLEPLTRRYYNEFRICTNCNQIYWKGSHYKRMKEFLDRIIQRGELIENE